MGRNPLTDLVLVVPDLSHSITQYIIRFRPGPCAYVIKIHLFCSMVNIQKRPKLQYDLGSEGEIYLVEFGIAAITRIEFFQFRIIKNYFGIHAFFGGNGLLHITYGVGMALWFF